MSHESPLTEKQQFWLEHIQASDQSGLSMKAYAQKNGLNVSAFYTWKKTLRRKGVIAGPPPAAAPLFHKAVVSDHPATRARLILPHGLVLELECGTDPHWVAQLVGALS